MYHSKKIILDSHLKTSFNSEIYKQGDIYLVTNRIGKHIDLPKNVKLIECPLKGNSIDLNELMKILFKEGIRSIFVEAGGKLCGSFIKENLADKIYHFIAPKILNDNEGKSCFSGDSINLISNCKNFSPEKVKKLDNDILIIYTCF